MSTVESLHREHTGADPTGVWSAPGRVNLIGEHTDYNQGLVLPFAIDRRTRCALSARADRSITARSSATTDTAQAHLDALSPQAMRGWSAYVLGVVWALQDAGADLTQVSGVDITVDSQVPVGAGLSSSAALECAVAVALNDHWELGLSGAELARICQRAENLVVGAPTGIMDQSASLLASADHALYLDCRDLSTAAVPLGLSAHDLAVLVIDTTVKHSHATGGYAERRASCELATHHLGLTSLRDLTVADLDRAQRQLDPLTFRRARHVVTENARVEATVHQLAATGAEGIGDLLLASHASMRDDFEISVPELDTAVDAAMDAGAIGARMTGGGFGGAAIAVVRHAHVEHVSASVMSAFARRGYGAPEIFTVTAAAGAGQDS